MSKKKKLIIVSIVLAVVVAVSVGLTLFFVFKPKKNSNPPPPHVHALSDWQTVQEATCTATGLQERHCTGCDFFEQKVIPAKGHTLGDWQTVKDATCTEAGTQERRCTSCDFSEQQEIAAKGHTEATEYNYVRHLIYCSVCGIELESGVHVWDAENSCSVCGLVVEPTANLSFTDIVDTDTCYLSGIGDMSDYETTLIIPATVNDKTVVKIDLTSLDRDANADKIARIEAIVMPDTIEEISDGAFQSFTALKQVYLSINLTEIPANAFSHCSNLRDFNVPAHLNKIGTSAFEECENITVMPLPSDVDNFEIEDRAFYDCSRLNTIDIPDSLTKIGNSAFYGCANLNSITLPQSLNALTLGNNCFQGTNLYEIVNLTSTSFTKNQTKFMFGNLQVPEKLTIVQNKADSKIFTTEDGFRFYDYDGERYLINYVGSLTTVTLPTFENQKYTILSMCFNLNEDIECVTLSESVKAIQDFAFFNCTNLTTVVIKNGVETIGTSAFQSGLISDFYVEYDSEENIPEGWLAGWNRGATVHYNDGTWVLDENGKPVPAKK